MKKTLKLIRIGEIHENFKLFAIDDIPPSTSDWVIDFTNEPELRYITKCNNNTITFDSGKDSNIENCKRVVVSNTYLIRDNPFYMNQGFIVETPEFTQDFITLYLMKAKEGKELIEVNAYYTEGYKYDTGNVIKVKDGVPGLPDGSFVKIESLSFVKPYRVYFEEDPTELGLGIDDISHSDAIRPEVNPDNTVSVYLTDSRFLRSDEIDNLFSKYHHDFEGFCFKESFNEHWDWMTRNFYSSFTPNSYKRKDNRLTQEQKYKLLLMSNELFPEDIARTEDLEDTYIFRRVKEPEGCLGKEFSEHWLAFCFTLLNKICSLIEFPTVATDVIKNYSLLCTYQKEEVDLVEKLFNVFNLHVKDLRK